MPGETQTSPDAVLRLRPVTLEEEIALEAYREAIKAGLASADGAADKILTASLSIATAFAGLLALVKPDKEPAPLQVAVPFVGFGLAALAAAWALAKGVRSLPELETSKVRAAVDKTLGRKQFWTKVAVLILIAALGIAAHAVVTSYGAAAG